MADLIGRRLLPLLCVAVLATTGCGATVATEQAPVAPGYPVTVENCGRQVRFDRPPERVVTNDPGITEIMFALGLADRMAGYVVSSGHDADIERSPWKADFDRVPRISEKIGKEVVQGANADMVFAGWNYGFSEGTGFTPDSVAELGMSSYLLTEACRNGKDKQRGIMSPLDALYVDLSNLGRIFGVPERAERLVSAYRSQVDEVARSVLDGARPRVFLYDDGTDQALTAGRNAAPQQIIEKAGGDNVFADLDDSWTRVNWEAVVRRAPEVILINDYGDPDNVSKKRQFLRDHPALADVPAVRNDRVFVLSYAELVEGPRNPAAVRAFADFLAGRAG